jgi:hypothetical protein
MSEIDILALVERRLAAIEKTRPAAGAYRDHAGWTAYYAAGRTLLDDLERDHGAKVRRGEPKWMKLAGISCSCTSGELALVRSWATKARRAQA